ncbi:hypothetical protein [Coprobacter tertius]|uniref:Uncharacterized protein n=1 Tax=Coprobacter tertius TaxID=2944915 RepID=A0ABT1MEZ2_9BACT|nr:hypothetical protein [Coprobacter tertius]MCP9611188.1 hypothetical protein [Coprobacter tertius]
MIPKPAIFVGFQTVDINYFKHKQVRKAENPNDDDGYDAIPCHIEYCRL